jgi:hypothetical protein
MKINKTYRSLLDKSINSMLSAIEIYNKPNFNYREETFAILAVNSWELILKAHLLKLNKYKMNSIYEMEYIKKKDGTFSSRQKPKTNRSGNAKTINLFEASKRLKDLEFTLSPNLESSIEALIELRDNAIHFHNEKQISKELQELGFACIKNYMEIIKIWNIEIDLTCYNFYLMPLAYVDSQIEVDSVLTDEVANYLSFVKNKVSKQDINDSNFDIAISIDINFKKSKSFDGLPFTFSQNGVGIELTEEDIRKKFPFTYLMVIDKCKARYSDFKQGKKFNEIMAQIKQTINYIILGN